MYIHTCAGVAALAHAGASCACVVHHEYIAALYLIDSCDSMVKQIRTDSRCKRSDHEQITSCACMVHHTYVLIWLQQMSAYSAANRFTVVLQHFAMRTSNASNNIHTL